MINTFTNTVIETVMVGADPEGVAITPDGTRAYVTNFDDNSVSVIDTGTDTVIETSARAQAQAATGAAFSADTRTIEPDDAVAEGRRHPDREGGGVLRRGSRIDQVSIVPITFDTGSYAHVERGQFSHEGLICGVDPWVPDL
ncbi:YncE family protein [Rhodococcus marinonascens]|uniref:YncE family protein n=1 Tax=Rhodococcus marinonascens TaxID=38311 RepID=UPI000B0FC4C8|nr:hypothetical protein [Rhodococcus marinonascens]